jgi:DNA topoisomerase-1
VAEGEVLKLERVDFERRLTQAPMHFGEASLVMELAEQGLAPAIPSAAAVMLLAEAGLVEIVDGTIRPTRRGTQACGLLTEHFPDLVSRERAAALEERAEAIARGEESLLGLLGTFWRTLPRDPGRARSRLKTLDGDGVPRACERCGQPMIEREGPYGRFLACSGYPSCRKTLGPDGKVGSVEVGLLCPRCSAAPMVERRSGSGRIFYGCRAYPRCRFTTHHRPLAEPCPACGHAFLLEKQTRGDGRTVFCGSCPYERDAPVSPSTREAPDPVTPGEHRASTRPWSGAARVVK